MGNGVFIGEAREHDDTNKDQNVYKANILGFDSPPSEQAQTPKIKIQVLKAHG